MELEQGIRKILNLMMYEAIGASYTYMQLCLYKLVEWDLYNVDLEEWENLKRMNFMTLLEDYEDKII